MKNFKEKNHKYWWLVASGGVIFLITLIIIAIFFWNRYGNNPYINQPREFGVTFSNKYAQQLGLHWQETYQASLKDLDIKLYRIPVYWDWIEGEHQGEYYFSDVQWMLDEAASNDAKVILAIGKRVPRWPECHPPAWLHDLSVEEQQQAELAMIEEVVLQFKDHPALLRWQVQNEPFLSSFGECPDIDEEFLEEAINVVKELDSEHEVMITDSGELGTWEDEAELGDILGVSMYRVTWNKWFGYFYYPLPPGFYTQKLKLVDSEIEFAIVSELQAEPWTGNFITETSLEQQYHSMDVQRFQDNIDYVQRTNFSEVLLWGVEWWYWLKVQQQDSRMWEAARVVFNNK